MSLNHPMSGKLLEPARLVEWLKMLTPLVLGLVAGAVLFKISVSSKFLVALVLAIVMAAGCCLLLLLRVNLSRLFLFGVYLSLPIPLGITFMYRDPTPFYVSGNGFNLDLFDVLAAAMLLFWLVDRYLSLVPNPRFCWHRPMLIPALGLLAINCLSASFTPFPFYGFSIVVSQIKMLLVFLVIANALATIPGGIKLAVYGVICTLAMEGIIAVEQKLLGVIFTAEHMGRSVSLTMQIGQEIINRVAGTLEHPNAFAMYLNLMIPVAIYFAWQEQRWGVRLLVITIVGLAIMAEIFSGSRSGWIALMVAMTVSLPLWLKRRGNNPLIGMAMAVVVCGLAGSILFAASSSFRDRLLLDDHGTAEVRYPLMEVAENMIVANPLTGVGLNHYAYYMEAYDRTADAIAFTYPYPVHNTFMLVAGETGIPSLLVLIALFVAALVLALKAFWRSEGVMMAASLGGFAALLTLIIHTLGNPSSFYDDHSLWAMFALIAGVYQKTIQSAPAASPAQESTNA